MKLENMKFSISYGKITIKTVGILPSGEVYLGDSFIQGDPIRSIRVVDGKSTKKLLSVYNGNNIFSIVWYDLRYCKSNPREEATFHLFIHPNGTLQFGFEFSVESSMNFIQKKSFIPALRWKVEKCSRLFHFQISIQPRCKLSPIDLNENDKISSNF
ncbi:hypothetical protein KSF78_0009654 [Schistosoma japonicum]|nr:hypothetical protein KSF78_0009654 [Schistosoma japonicum]